MHPLARRDFRQRATGEIVFIQVELVPGPGGERWHSVAVLRADGKIGAVAGLPTIEMVRGVETARRLFAKRQRALLAAGHERV